MSALFSLLKGDPSEVAGYRIAGRLGSGGQGVVFLGVDPSGGRVAIKMLRVEDESSRAQFAKEVASARRVAPFCTAQVIGFDLDAAAPYVISEFIEGRSLQQSVAEQGPISGPRLQRLAIGTVTALAAIHQAGVVHRDLKPANVMMGPEGPRVIDFGIARELSNRTTQASQLLGTPAYMSPEQVRGDRVGPETDLFSWASVMVFAATGRAPFEAGNMVASINRVAHEQPDLTGLPKELLPVLLPCFSKEAADRPTAQQALTMLLRQSTGHPIDSALADASADASAVLAAGTQFAEAQTDPPDAARSTKPVLSMDGSDGASTLVPGKPVAGDETLTWTSDHPPVPVPRPPTRSKKGRIAAILAVPVLLVAGIGIGLRVGDSEGAGTPTDPVLNSPSATFSESAAGTLPSALAGTWQGTVMQQSSSVDDWQWLVELDLMAGQKKPGTMDATDLGCTSQVTVTEASSDSAHLRAPVRAVNNPDGVCSPLGLITIELEPGTDTLDFFWQDTEDPTNVGNARLTRVSD